MAQFAIELFDVTREGGKTTLSAELSTLDQGGRNRVFEQVYPDSADPGLKIVGLHNTVAFVVDRTDRDNEGELQAYHLVPTRESKRQVPECSNVEVILFND